MPLDYILNNRLNITRYYKGGITDRDIGSWEFWRFQDTISKINKEIEGKSSSTNITSNSLKPI